jgi:SAM-dependent methyltransferase
VEGIESVAELWRIAEGARPALAYFRRRKLDTALTLGRFQSGAALLDVGCATGDYTFLLARRGFRMTGADLSPKSIQTAVTKAQRLGLREIRFVVDDAEQLAELPEASFDGVVSFSALRYVPNLDGALAAIRRVLKPGGAAALDFPNRFCPWFKLLKNRFGVETHFHDHHYSGAEIRRLFTAAGFTDVSVRHILFTSYLTPAPLLPPFRLLDAVGEHLPLLNQMAAILMARGVKR